MLTARTTASRRRRIPFNCPMANQTRQPTSLLACLLLRAPWHSEALGAPMCPRAAYASKGRQAGSCSAARTGAHSVHVRKRACSTHARTHGGTRACKRPARRTQRDALPPPPEAARIRPGSDQDRRERREEEHAARSVPVLDGDLVVFPGHGRGVRRGRVGPEVSHAELRARREGKLRPAVAAACNPPRAAEAVHEHHGHPPTAQLPGPHGHRLGGPGAGARLVRHPPALPRELILVHGDDFAVGVRGKVPRAETADVGTDEQRRHEDRPQAELRPAPGLAHLPSPVGAPQHVGVVEAAGAREPLEAVVKIGSKLERAPLDDVRGDPPGVREPRPASGVRRIVRDVVSGPVAAPATDGEENRAACPVEGVAHEPKLFEEPVEVVRTRRGVAIVLLQVVHAPLCEGPGIKHLVAKARGQALASLGPAVRVDPELQPLGMDIVRDAFDAGWKTLRVALQLARAVPLRGHPTVVQVQVLVAGGQQPLGHHGVGDGLDAVLPHTLAPQSVPRAEAHGWRQAEPVVQPVRGLGQKHGGGDAHEGRTPHCSRRIACTACPNCFPEAHTER
mmetsp:Transcript_30645/g.95234  ORF Transcript_30645/g.95234 Transcript_30645/m.95234 type:complete len:564 (+) Transcript_30645:190-1881(+)